MVHKQSTARGDTEVKIKSHYGNYRVTSRHSGTGNVMRAAHHKRQEMGADGAKQERHTHIPSAAASTTPRALH